MLREVLGFAAIFWSTLLFSMDTELLLYRPMTETTNHASVDINTKTTGECLGQSHRIKREDAWRCVAHGEEYDPCFVERFGSHLKALCIQSPWSKHAVELTVASPLDNQLHETLDMSKTLPWAIELANGEQCEAIASSEVYDGLPVHYRCGQNAKLIGHVQHCSSQWKMLRHDISGIETVEIVKAWF